MELKFVWIEEYKNIKNTGFNFDHSTDEEFQFINNELLISPTSITPKNFFKDNVSGVTAIVGRNGSGKTNLTEFINYNLAHATNGGLATYIKSKGITILDHWIFVQNEIEIINEDFLTNIGYKLLRYEDAPLDGHLGGLRWHHMEQNKYIYYNPTFDLRGIPVSDNLVNISTTMLVYNDIKNSDKLFPYSIDKNPKINQLDAFDSMEKSRICDFILNLENANNYIDFFPEKIRISIDTITNNYFLNKKYFDKEQLKEIKNASINYLQNELDNLESSQLYRYDFEQYFARQEDNSSIRYYNIPVIEQKSIFFNLFFINLFQMLLNKEILFPKDYFRRFIYNEVQEDPIADQEIENIILKLREEIIKIFENIEWNNFELQLPDEKYFGYEARKKKIYKYLGTIDVSINENKGLLNNAISLMDQLLDEKRFFSYEPINQFSSGQKHLLTLYSRFFWAKKKIKKSELKPHGIEGESIVIFIDEGEVALHPEWQRVFFDKIINFLSELFNDKKVQLILTTHSPFVLSDIPKSNVLFLDKDENGNTKISNIEREQTFASNIHELLADSFFLNEGFMGDFSKNKILDLIKYLTFDEQISESETNIKPQQNWSEDDAINLINIIGESVIKERLLALFDKKFTFKTKESIIARMTELEKELKKFE